MPHKDDIAARPETRSWTRAEDYMAALARRRTARRSREPNGARTQPETPRFSLSTLPFLALFVGLAVLTVAIIIAAWPGGEARRQPNPQPAEVGTAAKGWFQEAERQFR